MLFVPLVASGGERELWSLWQKHLGAPDDHAAVVQACRAYASALPEDPFLPVVEGIEAWHLFQAENTTDAVRRLAPHVKDGKSDALGRGAQRLAQGWITRIQYPQIAAALQAYYRDEVRYPPDLQTLADYPGLAESKKLPLKDAWGRPWRYRLTGFEGVPGFWDQKYLLESLSIPPPFDLEEALAMPYAEQIVVQPSRATRTGATVVKLEYVSQEGNKESAVTQVGETVDGLYIAYAGQGIVILCDSLHWKVVPWK